MKKLTAKIRELVAKRKRWRRTDRKADANIADLYDALHEAQKHRSKIRKRLSKLRGKEGDFYKKRRELLTDRHDEVQAVIDRTLLRIDAQQDREKKAEQFVRNYGGRIRKLKERREKIRTSRGDLTAHFSMAEFDCREGGPVPDYMRDDLRALCERILEKMRDKFGAAHVNSGHRWTWYNAKIGGASNSFHCYEVRKSQPAADCTFASGTPSQWAAYARSLGVGGVGQYSTFVHVDTGPRRDWWG